MKAQFRSGPGKAFKLIFALLVIVIISSCNICFKVLMSFIIIYIFVKIIFSISILYLILVGARSLFKKKRKKRRKGFLLPSIWDARANLIFLWGNN
jgi:hypothetical protein